jgi:hypothetical protein
MDGYFYQAGFLPLGMRKSGEKMDRPGTLDLDSKDITNTALLLFSNLAGQYGIVIFL